MHKEYMGNQKKEEEGKVNEGKGKFRKGKKGKGVHDKALDLLTGGKPKL